MKAATRKAGGFLCFIEEKSCINLNSSQNSLMRTYLFLIQTLFYVSIEKYNSYEYLLNIFLL
ncbi:MAG TPA: hypothetical protein DEQ14_12220 [Treponema sp.]|nr:hypothetical protein [Treponema sp.]